MPLVRSFGPWASRPLLTLTTALMDMTLLCFSMLDRVVLSLVAVSTTHTGSPFTAGSEAAARDSRDLTHTGLWPGWDK